MPGIPALRKPDGKMAVRFEASLDYMVEFKLSLDYRVRSCPRNN